MSRTITLEKPWSYVTPEKTIDFPAGEHEVFNYIAEKAEAEGVIPKESADGATDRASKARTPRTANSGESE